MASFHPALVNSHRELISAQKIFFVASSAVGSRVNISPKGTNAIRILSRGCIVYLDQTGSGNETAAHINNDGRLTIMFCSFSSAPMILRLYGHGRTIAKESRLYRQLLRKYYAGVDLPGTRQAIALVIDSVQTSCGYGVPMFEFVRDRGTLDKWAEAKGSTLGEYQQQHNTRSIDGLPTPLLPTFVWDR